MTDRDGSRPGPSRGMWRAIMIGLALVAAWVAFLIFFGPEVGLPPPRLAASRPSVAPVDFGWTLHDLDGKPVDFATFRGRPILLNLWATWCAPCVAEMPSIAALASDPRMEGVAVVCVSLDDSREAPRRFARGKDWRMTMLHAADVPPAFLTQGIPATFILAPDGRVVAFEEGAAKWDDPTVIDFFARLAKPNG